ncbi:hypothetical protein M1N59_01555 [Dehalococcoidales bacterium]|nr:hypothetical protein [Dehalococcoidales bacterium]
MEMSPDEGKPLSFRDEETGGKARGTLRPRRNEGKEIVVLKVTIIQV